MLYVCLLAVYFTVVKWEMSIWYPLSKYHLYHFVMKKVAQSEFTLKKKRRFLHQIVMNTLPNIQTPFLTSLSNQSKMFLSALQRQV